MWSGQSMREEVGGFNNESGYIGMGIVEGFFLFVGWYREEGGRKQVTRGLDGFVMHTAMTEARKRGRGRETVWKSVGVTWSSINHDNGIPMLMICALINVEGSGVDS